MRGVETTDFGDRRFELLLERLDRIAAEINQLNRRLDHEEGLLRISRELATLNESLQAIAYAALGTQGPQVRRRRTG
jgi:type VI protein secretion system component VasK